MVSTHPTGNEEGESSSGPLDRALAEAADGLETIRDEGPPTEPVYPTHGSVEAREEWAFDSASYERAQTAQDALNRVDAVLDGRVPAPS